MLPRADLNSPRPLATLEAASPVTSATDARQEVFRRLTQIAIGRELQATVESMLDDGSFVVRVADTAARMALPVGSKVGDMFNMVFVAREPRPTFLLTQQGGSAPATLSSTGRLIGQLLQSAQQQGASPAVNAHAPLLPAPAIDPKQLATAMQDGLSTSGLFYESHLHEWISGSRSLSDLAREPQSNMTSPGQSKAAASPSEGDRLDLSRLANDLRELSEGAGKLTTLIRDAQVQSGANTDADVLARAQAPLPTIEPEAARIIHSQLNTLENHQIRWQGELWPGQQMEWEINEDTPERSGGEAAEQSVWSSAVRFELPHLGGVSASIRLVGDRVHVQVHAGSDSVAGMLHEYRSLLADRLDAAGSPLDSFLVKRDE
ncbi:flagellar hook-length control protein FliK [Noviherbaspirillum saxi]|nr:flagellar hook-length control protein FliK [Noviherbaspirillum saxi]